MNLNNIPFSDYGLSKWGKRNVIITIIRNDIMSSNLKEKWEQATFKSEYSHLETAQWYIPVDLFSIRFDYPQNKGLNRNVLLGN